MISIKEFEKYMSRPNIVYFLFGIGLIIFGIYISFSPIMDMHLSVQWKDTITNLNSVPIVGVLLFSPFFYWIMGCAYSGTFIFYYFCLIGRQWSNG